MESPTLCLKGSLSLGIRLTDDKPKRVHDELDAITAAYVGLCWLQDAYEAAGPPRRNTDHPSPPCPIDTMPTPKGPPARDVERMFSRLARRYDILNTIITLGRHRCWKRATAIAAGAAQGQGLGLDVATGTGDLAFILGEQSNVTSVVGVDLSRAMLKVASRKAAEHSVACPVSFLEADALSLCLS